MILKTNFLGTEEMIRERLTAFRQAGVTTLRIATKGKSWKEKTESLEEAMDLVAHYNRGLYYSEQPNPLLPLMIRFSLSNFCL